MKQLQLFLGACVFLGSISAIGQTKTYTVLGDYGSPVQRYIDSIAKVKNEDERFIFNRKALSVLFSDEVGSYFNDDEDFSTQRYYASLSTKDNSFSFAYTFNPCYECDEIEKIKHIATVGFKAKTNDNFAELYRNGDFTASNIGISLKYTRINNGKLKYDSIIQIQKDDKYALNFVKDSSLSQSELINIYRNVLLYPQIDKEVADYLDTNYKKDTIKAYLQLLKTKVKSKIKDINDKDIDDINTSVLKKKGNEFYTKIAEEEVKYLKENKLYKYIENSWFTFNLYIPLNSESYSLFDRSTETITSKRFYPVSGSAAFTLYKKWSSGQSFYFTPKISIRNNNTILANEESATTFQTTETFGNGVLLTQKEAFDVEYENFMTSTVQAEVVFFIYNDMIGFSPAIERNFGKFRSVGWKLGIPISLKDKEGKPSVNFELQWKEIRVLGEKSNHFVGISANFLFGKFLN
jgi:hypothetical protein